MLTALVFLWYTEVKVKHKPFKSLEFDIFSHKPTSAPFLIAAVSIFILHGLCGKGADMQ